MQHARMTSIRRKPDGDQRSLKKLNTHGEGVARYFRFRYGHDRVFGMLLERISGEHARRAYHSRMLPPQNILLEQYSIGGIDATLGATAAYIESFDGFTLLHH